MSARHFIFCIFLLTSFSGISQKPGWVISGIVSDEKKAPVQFANVFINNTSIGTATNESGNFQLKIPDEFSQVELIISFVGFRTVKRKISYSSEIQVFKFQLEDVNLLNEVVISAKQDKDWKKKWRIFEKALLGDSKFSKDCKILNPDVIRLEYTNEKKVLAKATQPILIRNNALGYQISYQMDKFETDGITSYFSGLKYFEKIDTNNINVRTKWDKNQKDVFSDSFRSFLVALSLNKLDANDFDVYKMTVIKNMYYGQTTVANEVKDGVLIPVDATEICSFDKDTESFFIHSEYPLLIFLKNRFQMKPFFSDSPYKYAEIVLPKGYASFTENGWLIRPNGIVLKDYWGYEGFANMLPDDYNVNYLVMDIQEESGLTKITQKPITLPIKTKEKKSKLQLNKVVLPAENIDSQGIQLEKRKSIAQKAETTEFNFVDADYKVQIKESDHSFTVYDLLRKIPGLRVTFSSITGQYSIYFIGSNTRFHSESTEPTPALVLDGNFISDSEQVMAIIAGLTVRDIKEIGVIRYGNNAGFGARGANGTIVINTTK